MSNQKEKLQKAAKYFFNLGIEIFPARTSLKNVNGELKKIPILPEWKNRTYDYNSFIMELRSGIFNTLCIKTGSHSDLFVLDLDNKNGVSGIDSLKRLGIRIPENTPCVKTQSGGIHYYFLFHNSLKNYSTGGDRKYSIDWRGNGGLIFAPPTKINDREYKFIKPILINKSNLAYPPKSLLRWILSHKQKKNNNITKHGNKSIFDLSDGQRNHLFNCIRNSANAKNGKRSEIDFSTMTFAIKIGLAKDEIKKHIKDVGKFKNRPDYFECTYCNAFKAVRNRAISNG